MIGRHHNRHGKAARQGRESLLKSLSFIDTEKLQDIVIFKKSMPKIKEERVTEKEKEEEENEEELPWNAAEELALLTLMQSHSCNWSVIADVMSMKFHKTYNSKGVKDHYMKAYLLGDLAKAMQEDTEPPNSLLVDHMTMEDDEVLEAVVDENTHKSVPQSHLRTIGYKPLRGDFDNDHENISEHLLDDVEFLGITDDYDKNMNLLLIDTYNYRILEREEKKEAVRKFKIVERFLAKTNPLREKKPGEEMIGGFEVEVKPMVSIDDYPEADTLTAAEKKLCKEIKLKPGYYRRYKLYLSYIDHEKSAGRYPKHVIPPHMTVAQCVKVVDFLKERNMIVKENLLDLIKTESGIIL